MNNYLGKPGGRPGTASQRQSMMSSKMMGSKM